MEGFQLNRINISDRWAHQRRRYITDVLPIGCLDCGTLDDDAHEKWCIELKKMQANGAAYVPRRADGSAR